MSETGQGYSLTFTGDFSAIRKDLEALKQEISQGIQISVRGASGGPAGAAAGSGGRIIGLLGTEPASLQAEDRRVEQRQLGSMASVDRIDRVQARFGSNAYGPGFGPDASENRQIARERGVLARLPQFGPGADRWAIDKAAQAVTARNDSEFEQYLEEQRVQHPPRSPWTGGGSGGGYGGGGGRGGVSPYINPFSARGLARLAGSGLAVYGALEAAHLAIGLAQASDIERNPQRILQRWNSIDSPFDASGDAYLGASASSLAATEGREKRFQAGENIPLLGTGVQLLDELTGERGRRQNRRDSLERDVSIYRRSKEEDIDLNVRVARLSRNPVIEAQAKADRELAPDLNAMNQAGPDVYGTALSTYNRHKNITDAEVSQTGAKTQSGQNNILAASFAYRRDADAYRADLVGDPLKALSLRREGEIATIRQGYLDRAVDADDLSRVYLGWASDQQVDSTNAKFDLDAQNLNIRMGSGRIRARGNVASNWARARNDEFGAGLASNIAESTARISETTIPADRQLAINEGVASLGAYLAVTARGNTFAAQDLQGSTAQNNLLAQGLTFAAQRQGVQNTLNAGLRVLPDNWLFNDFLGGNVLRGAFQQNALSQNALIARGQGLYNQGVQNTANVTNALTLGNEPGGYQQTAQVRDIFGQSTLAAAGAQTPQARDLQLQIGLNRLTALQRDIENSGGPQEVAPGSVGPGFGDSGDQGQAERELIEAIKNLTDAMNGNGGSGAGGDFGDNSPLPDF